MRFGGDGIHYAASNLGGAAGGDAKDAARPKSWRRWQKGVYRQMKTAAELPRRPSAFRKTAGSRAVALAWAAHRLERIEDMAIERDDIAAHLPSGRRDCVDPA